MNCPKCGQATQTMSQGIITYSPCSCPIDYKAYRDRMDKLRKRIDEAYARIGSKRPQTREYSY